MEQVDCGDPYEDPRLIGIRTYAMQTEDGRDLGIDVRGSGNYVVVDFHGSPSSRRNLMPRGFALTTLDIRLISYDRPGYGLSSPNPGRSIADSAKDVEQIADKFGVEHFAVVARSGGVPHALGCAALLPDRVTGLFAMSGLSPQESSTGWTAGMTQDNKRIHAAAKENITEMKQRLVALAKSTQGDMHAIIRNFYEELPFDDVSFMMNHQVMSILAWAHAEGLRSGAEGWIEDTLAVNREWGFNLKDIVCPVVFLHGSEDPFANQRHSLALQKTVPGSVAIAFKSFGHFGGLRNLPSGLAYLRDRTILYERTGRHTQATHEELRDYFTAYGIEAATIEPSTIITDP